VGVTGALAAPNRRDRKKAATRVALREAALRLALRQGIAGTTVEQIAAEADVAVRTFFNHFSGKEEAVAATVAVGAETLIDELRARPAGESVLEAFREAVFAAMDRSLAASRDYADALWLVRTTPALLPQQLAVLASQERALADAILERTSPTPAAPDAADSLHAQVCAVAALATLRLVLERWFDGATGPDDTPPLGVLRVQLDAAITQLAAGLDRPARTRPTETMTVPSTT
jgi:AcrR family transcriptional regulator